MDTMMLRLIAYRRAGERWYRLFTALSAEEDGRRRRRLRRMLHDQERIEDAMFDGMCREVEAAAAANQGGQHGNDHHDI